MLIKNNLKNKLLILNEKKYVEQILNDDNYLLTDNYFNSLVLMARYYFALKGDKTQTRESLISFLESHYPKYNEKCLKTVDKIVEKYCTEKLQEINEIAIMGCKPNLTILFDLDPRIGQERINKNKDREVNRLDLASLEYHDKVRAGYLKVADMFKERIVVIDASKSFEEVIEDVYSIIKTRLEEENYERVSK